MRALLAGAAGGGHSTAHPTLCLRCADAVESGLVCRADEQAGATLPHGHHRACRLTALGAIAALVVLVADQASKWWILNVLDLPDLRPDRRCCRC